MKTASGLLLAVLSLPLLAGPRNPFLLPSSPCESLLKRLDGWQLRGVFYRAEQENSIALMKFSRQQWQRVKEGQFIAPDVQVTTLLDQHLRVSLRGACEGSYYHWKIQGGSDDKTYRGRRADARTADELDEKQRHSDAG